MAGMVEGTRVAILATDGVERVELEQPREALDKAGARTELLSLRGGRRAPARPAPGRRRVARCPGG